MSIYQIPSNHTFNSNSCIIPTPWEIARDHSQQEVAKLSPEPSTPAVFLKIWEEFYLLPVEGNQKTLKKIYDKWKKQEMDLLTDPIYNTKKQTKTMHSYHCPFNDCSANFSKKYLLIRHIYKEHYPVVQPFIQEVETLKNLFEVRKQ